MRKRQTFNLGRLLGLVSAIGSGFLLGMPLTMADSKHDQHFAGPGFFTTPSTGTSVDAPARNQQFLCLSFIPLAPSDIKLTETTTPWVQGRKVIPSKIAYFDGAVDWNEVPGAKPKFRTWVKDGKDDGTGTIVKGNPNNF